MTKHAVVIAGAGPTGLMLAGELAIGGIDVVVVERRASQALEGSRAGGLHSRTIELLDQRGIAERFLSQGKVMQVAGFATSPLDISDFPTRHPYGLALFQDRFEAILATWVAELSVPILREREITDFSEDDAGIAVALSSGETIEAQYLVGCDGGRSLVRKAAGIDFPGWDPSVSYLIAEASITEPPPVGARRGPRGVNGIASIEGGKRVRIVLAEPEVARSDAPTLDDVRAALVAVYGTDFGAHDASWVSRFTDATRQASEYRKGRVLLAGDAAHIHSPTGGQGLNLGVHDAFNLGWKLASVVRGDAPDTLLDSYHAERHPIAAHVMRLTMAQTGLNLGDERHQAAREVIADLLKMDEPRRRYAATMSGLAVHYDLGRGHPLLGRRMPDLSLTTAGGATRVLALLHRARAALVRFPTSAPLDVTPWADRVQHLEASTDDAWELPVLGAVAAPSAVLVRPDGYVAWVGDGTDRGLHEALTRWLGPPR